MVNKVPCVNIVDRPISDRPTSGLIHTLWKISNVHNCLSNALADSLCVCTQTILCLYNC